MCVTTRRYASRACTGRNELGSGGDATSPTSCEADVCQSSGASTCESFEYKEDGTTCRASNSCVFEESVGDDDTDLYIWVPPPDDTVVMNGVTYAQYIGRACEGLNELGVTTSAALSLIHI